MRTSLGNIARANRWFGGRAAVRYGIERLLQAPRATPDTRHASLTLLDLGTGAGDIPAAVRAWGAARGTPIRTFGLERLRPAAHLARAASLDVVLGCATRLPLRDGAVDLVTVSQVLHHFDAEAAVRILREAGRVARRGVVVADLLRSGTAAALFGVGARVLGFDAHTVADGITSVGRGYAPDELESLCRRAGIAAVTAVRPGWRVVAWGARPAHRRRSAD